MVLNHDKMSFPWKLFCFLKSKTKPLRLQKNMILETWAIWGAQKLPTLSSSFPFLPFVESMRQAQRRVRLKICEQ